MYTLSSPKEDVTSLSKFESISIYNELCLDTSKLHPFLVTDGVFHSQAQLAAHES
jgi:hypothetical protein